MATIEKRERKNGTTYKAVVRIKGLPPQRRSFKRITDAKLWVQQTEASIRKGDFQNVVQTAARKTLSDVIARYRADILPAKNPGTQETEAAHLAYWERELGSYALSYITPELAGAKVKELQAIGYQRKPAGAKGKVKTYYRSPRTVKYYRDMLALLFKFARQWGWTGSNPLDAVPKVTKLKNERVRYLSDEERQALLAACQASDNAQLYPIVVFALSTGARKGEILGLTLADLDLRRGAAVLRDTKNGETRSVPIVGHLKTLLEEHVIKTKAFYAGMQQPILRQWLFPRSDGLAPIDIRNAWENARDAASLVDFRFHDLRHSTASYLAMNGASLLEIADILGHKTLQMVKRYAHLSDSHKKSVVVNLNKRLFVYK